MCKAHMLGAVTGKDKIMKKIKRILVEIKTWDRETKIVSWPASSEKHLFEDAASSMGVAETYIVSVTILERIEY